MPRGLTLANTIGRPRPGIGPARRHRPTVHGILSAFCGSCPLPKSLPLSETSDRPHPGIRPARRHRPTVHGILSAFCGSHPLPKGLTLSEAIDRPHPGIRPARRHRPTVHGILSAFCGSHPLPKGLTLAETSDRPHPGIRPARRHHPAIGTSALRQALHGILPPRRTPRIERRPHGQPRLSDPRPPRRQQCRLAPRSLALQPLPAQRRPGSRRKPPARVPSRFARVQRSLAHCRRDRRIGVVRRRRDIRPPSVHTRRELRRQIRPEHICRSKQPRPHDRRPLVEVHRPPRRTVVAMLGARGGQAGKTLRRPRPRALPAMVPASPVRHRRRTAAQARPRFRPATRRQVRVAARIAVPQRAVSTFGSRRGRARTSYPGGGQGQAMQGGCPWRRDNRVGSGERAGG